EECARTFGPYCLEHVERAQRVNLKIAPGIDHGCGNGYLCRKMVDGLRVPHRRAHGLIVSNVGVDDGEVAIERGEPLSVGRRARADEVVEDDNLVASSHRVGRLVAASEASASGDDRPRARKLEQES